MRSSSVKTLVVAVSVVVSVSVTIAAPTAHARPAQNREVVVRDEPRGIERVGRVVRRILNRLTGGVTTNNWPSIPPAPSPNNTQ